VVKAPECALLGVHFHTKHYLARAGQFRGSLGGVVTRHRGHIKLTIKPVISFERAEHLEQKGHLGQVKNALRSCADAPGSRARLMVRSMMEILMQPIPPITTLADFGEELKVAGMQSQKCDSFLSHLRLRAPSSSSVAHLLELKVDDVKAIETASEFSQCESLLLRTVLGSVTHPFEFAQEPAAGTDENKAMNKTGARSINMMMKSSGAKGGALSAVSGELTTRREPIESYYPPPEFDVEAIGSQQRNLKRLRLKVIKEIENYTGHLYPSKEERDIVLTAIQALCGPPDGGRSWNIWCSSEAGGAVKKHKGMAISDLEKARRDPGAYGCHGTAVEGQMRPARPVRPVPVSALLSRGLQTPVTNSRNSDDNASAGDKHALPNPNGDGEVLTEEQILATAAMKKDEVDKLRQDKEELKKQAALRKKEDQAAKKQKKDEEKAAAKEAVKLAKLATKGAAKAQPKAPLAKKRKHSSDDEASEADEEPCEYLRKIKATVTSNNQWLKLLEDVSEKNCKILTENCETIQEITTGGLAQDR